MSKEIKDNSQVIYAVVLLVAIALLVAFIKLADPQTLLALRHMYCTANEANAIECASKGWW